MSEIEPPPYAPRRGVIAWMFFDWAAQPYHTLLLTFIFAPYFAAHVAETPAAGQAMWGWATGIAGAIIAVLAPLLGALADESGPRKPWVAGFSVLAVVGAGLLYLATPDGTAPVVLVLGAFVVALIGIEFAAVFTNAMMPGLVPRAGMGRLSGSGWALGYAGGVVSLVMVLGFMAADAETGRTIIGVTPVLGLDPALHEGDRIAGPFSAAWYIVFVLPFFLFTPDVAGKGAGLRLKAGLRRLRGTLAGLPRRSSLSAFLISSMLYRDGLNALYAFGGIYAAGVLGLSIIEVGVFGVLAAVAGVLGAFAGGRLDQRFGPRPVVMAGCWLLVLACLTVVSTTQTETLFVVPVSSERVPLIVFYIAGTLIGAAGGALQAASRTLLIDQVGADESASAFGLYALTGKATAFAGPIAIALVTGLTQNQRIGILPVIALLAIGAVGLMWVRQRGEPAAPR